MNQEGAHDLLFVGIAEKDLNKVKDALEIIKDVNIRYDDGDTILHCASSDGKLEIIEFLISQGAGVSVNIQNDYGATPLHYASGYKNLEIVEFLISHGANVNVNIQKYDGSTPLHLASMYGNLDVVKYLITHGADVGIQNKNGDTPLEIAACHNNLKVIKYLTSNICRSTSILKNKHAISNFNRLFKPIKEHIHRMYAMSRFLHQKYPGVEVIGNVLRFLFDPDEKLFSDEELMAIATFGTQNRPKVLLKTEENKYKYLYYPLSEEFPHLFCYLKY